jgi:predicted permease
MKWLETLAQDIRHASRTLLREKSFAILSILILAIGIGANTAVFSIVNSVLLQPLRYGDPDRLVAVQEIVPHLGNSVLPVNARHYQEWKDGCSCFEDVALAASSEFNLTGSGEPERLSAALVTANFFSVLRVAPWLGRGFSPEEQTEGRDNVVIVSNRLWQRRYGADPTLVGQNISLDGIPHQVAGILPDNFRHHLRSTLGQTLVPPIDVYKPWSPPTDEGVEFSFNYSAVARLGEGVGVEQATAELNTIQAGIAAQFKSTQKRELRALLTPLQVQAVEGSRNGLLLLLAAIGTVLLVACLNLGNLMLVRATARNRETAIRCALGAPRLRVFRSALVESLTLALTGAVIGVALAFALTEVFSMIAPVGLARADEVRLDGYALAFAAVLSVGTAMIFGIAPAWRSAHADPQDALRAGGRSLTEGGRKGRLRQILLGAEVGLTTILLVVAGLLVASVVRINDVERGFDTESVLTAQVNLPGTRYPESENRLQFYERLIASLEAKPGVASAGVVTVLPLQGMGWADLLLLEGDTRPMEERDAALFRAITARYLAALGIPLLSGRQFDDADDERRVALISLSLAERVWPGMNPIGQRFRDLGTDIGQPPFEVVGVVGDIRTAGLDSDAVPSVYVPMWYRSPRNASIAVRTSSDPRGAAGVLRSTVAELDPELALSQVQTMTQIENDSLAQRRFQTNLVSGFAISALLLAALGTYSVISYSIARRTSEIGIRLALGARMRHIVTMVVRQGLWPAVVGLVLGIYGAVAASRFISAMLFNVSPTDTSVYTAVAGVIGLSVLLACWVPARRAARIAPTDALRYE